MGLVLLYSNHRRKPKRDLFSFVSWACARYIFTCYICFLFSTVESITRLLPDGCPRRLVSRCMPQTRSQLNRYDRKLMASLIRGQLDNVFWGYLFGNFGAAQSGKVWDVRTSTLPLLLLFRSFFSTVSPSLLHWYPFD